MTYATAAEMQAHVARKGRAVLLLTQGRSAKARTFADAHRAIGCCGSWVAYDVDAELSVTAQGAFVWSDAAEARCLAAGDELWREIARCGNY